MKQLGVCLIGLLLFCSSLALRPNAVLAASLMRPVAQTVMGDWISPLSDLTQCLTVNGSDPSAAPGIILDTCRGTAQQRWTHDDAAGQWQTELDTNYCLASVDDPPYISVALTVHLCTDPRAFALEPNPTLPGSYRVVGSNPVLVLDWGSFGYVALVNQYGADLQLFRTLVADLAIVNSQGCAITYPFDPNAPGGAATYERELACDHVAKLQPPYVVPAAAQRDPSLFPGVVPAGTPLVTNRAFSFNSSWRGMKRRNCC